ncbi:acyl-CoA dehydrogenase family protein [Nocardioides sp.]|uniref:acyl-CoA dehydrogenase family protein n=1 Tax=Nocardioides sp. TaxID=35761 RepID=UPI0039E66590
MQLALPPDLAAFQLQLRDFFENQVPMRLREPFLSGARLERDWVVGTHQVLFEAGIAVPHWPVEWGGKPWTPLQRHIWSEELYRAGVFPPLSSNTHLVGPVLLAFGTEEQKRRFLPPTASCDIFWAQGFSEPEAGSDLASVRTTAVLDGDEWVVNGQKTWTSLAHMSDWIFCLVRTDPDAPKRQQGISFLLVDLKSPGITVRPIRLIDGDAEVNEVFFDNVRVPADQLVGEVNKGWDYAKYLLGNERVSVAQIGHTKLRLTQAKRFAQERLADGSALIDDRAVAMRLAELEVQLAALEVTALRVVGESADGKPDPASSVLKLRGTQLLQDVVAFVLDLAGGDALAAEADDGSGITAWARRAAAFHLNTRKVSIYGGSNEIQRGIIASSVLGL